MYKLGYRKLTNNIKFNPNTRMCFQCQCQFTLFNFVVVFGHFMHRVAEVKGELLFKNSCMNPATI